MNTNKIRSYVNIDNNIVSISCEANEEVRKVIDNYLTNGYINLLDYYPLLNILFNKYDVQNLELCISKNKRYSKLKYMEGSLSLYEVHNDEVRLSFSNEKGLGFYSYTDGLSVNNIEMDLKPFVSELKYFSNVKESILNDNDNELLNIYELIFGKVDSNDPNIRLKFDVIIKMFASIGINYDNITKENYLKPVHSYVLSDDIIALCKEVKRCIDNADNEEEILMYLSKTQGEELNKPKKLSKFK